jgi:hypothetical protein
MINPGLLLGVVVAPTLPFALAAYVGWNIVYSLAIYNGITVRQLVTPERLQSRVNTTARVIAWGGAPFGAAIGGLIAEASDVRTAYALMALAVAVSAALAWLTPLRRHDAVVAPAEP